MMETVSQKLELNLRVARKMIANFESKVNEAVEKEDWRRAADLKSFVNGMNQMLVLFEQVDTSEGE